MLCYYFTDSKYGIENLQKKRLKVSNLNKLNDPFEMLCIQAPDIEVRTKLAFLKDITAERFGILCFSGNWTNPVQWGHYSENHSGLCLVFDIPEECLQEITYVPTRLSPEDINIDNGDASHTLITTKFIHWQYEEEHRFITRLNSLHKENELYFRAFDETLKLKKVIIGAHSEVKKANLVKIVPRGVEVFHAMLHDIEFKVAKDITK